MRTKLFFLLTILLSSCLSDQSDDATDKFGFLFGNWERIGQEEGLTTESWKMVHNHLEGVGMTTVEADTTFYEEMNISEENDIWSLEVVGVNEGAVSFAINEVGDRSFVARNDAHDFPKYIKYWIKDDTLKAEVGDSDVQIDFSFVKKN